MPGLCDFGWLDIIDGKLDKEAADDNGPDDVIEELSADEDDAKCCWLDLR